MNNKNIKKLSEDYMRNIVFPDAELLPSVTEIFELKLANLEYYSLRSKYRSDRLAYFQSYGSQNTLHFKLCNSRNTDLAKGRSSLTKSYFEVGRFSTGYATHSLFPYRGKFHPQLIKAIFNIIGLYPGDIILDPMCGSGTTIVEATLSNIKSIGYDISPFCVLMTKSKNDSLYLTDSDELQALLKSEDDLFYKFKEQSINFSEIADDNEYRILQLALLAFYDSMGYSLRVNKKSHRQLFSQVLERYINTVLDFIHFKHSNNINLENPIEVSVQSATEIPLENNSIDGIITSPPYSFAIDYSANDKPQLEHLGYDISKLKDEMIGLKGRGKKEKLEIYFNDMRKVCEEASRVLKKDKYFVLIIGSNTNQTGGIRLEEPMIEYCEKAFLILEHAIIKPIKGMRNTMKEEHILFFKKEN
ncbi:MAG: hypothetical protein K9M95_04375 [Candidatus Cloacimonetes bacterium]|nr:hypothetical protein [Candidatus Cloacimonadota bacterium]